MKITKIAVSASLFLLVLNYPEAQKATNTREAKSRIERALVYQDRALITRRSEVLDLNPGIHEIYFRNLPVSLNDESVRAEIKNRSAVRIQDVEVKLYHLEKVTEKKIRDLQEKRDRLGDEYKKIEHNLRLLKFRRHYLHGVRNHFLGVRGEGIQPVPVTGAVSPQEYDAMLKYLTREMRLTLADLLEEEKKERLLQSRLSFMNKQLNQAEINRRASKSKKMVLVTLDVKQKTNIKLEISYINLQVSWKPRYDIRVFRDRGETEFNGFGIVSQKSGEDWERVALAFSTAQPARRARLPDMKPVYVISRPAGGEQGIAAQEAIRKHSPSSSQRVGSLVFPVPRRTTVPADGSPHRTSLSRQVFPVKFEYLCIPRLSPHVYLRAIGKNSMSRPILQGDLNIFMGNNFMGPAYTENILPGEEFELTLNTNENIRVTRELDEQTSQSAGILSSRRVFKYSYVIKVENYSGEHMMINVLDQLPLGKSENVNISPASFSLQPDLQTKKGILKWRLTMKPGEVRKITYGFNISVPAKMEPAFYLHRKKGRFQRSLKELDTINQDELMQERNRPVKAPSMKKFKY